MSDNTDSINLTVSPNTSKTCLPFSNETKDVYICESWRSQLLLIQHLSLFNNVLMLMTAQAEMGKSTFLNALETMLIDDMSVSRLSAEHNLETLTAHLDEIFVTKTKTEDLSNQIRKWVDMAQKEQKHYLFLIDDAHQLPKDVCRHLVQFILTQKEKAFIHFFLIGLPTLPLQFDGLDMTIDSKPISHLFTLPILTVEDVKSYLTFRWECSEQEMPFPFSDSHITSIHALAQGRFKWVNEQAGRIIKQLNTRALRPSVPVTRRTLIKASGVLVGISMGLFIFAQTDTLPESDRVTAVQFEPQQTVSKAPIVALHDMSIQPKNRHLDQIGDKRFSASIKPRSPLKAQFVLQLLAGRDLQALKTYANQKALKDIQFYQTEHKGEPWFILAKGPYVSIKKAQKARGSLSSDFIKHGPWVRKMQDIGRHIA